MHAALCKKLFGKLAAIGWTIIMKVITVLLATVAVTLAKFQYKEEWELWKKVVLSDRFQP